MSVVRWSRFGRLRHHWPCSHYSTSGNTGLEDRNPKLLIWDETVSPKGQKVNLTSRRPKLLTWYACGPTVYDSAHIGHASSYIRLDIMRRIMEHSGYTVLQVMGVTDIDDKIIARSQLTNLPWTQLSQKYELEFFQDLERMNVKAPDVKARVSQFIPQIIGFVSDLLTANFAYTTADGTVYFDTTKNTNGILFRQASVPEDTEEVQQKSKRASMKRNPHDFALWKGVKPGEPFWETPWGKGRPGWHIECSVMATHFFGPCLDIHSGGMDLTFPHHENESIQCCAKFGYSKWVSHWIHTGHLHLNGDVKMSKSIGNTVSIEEFLSKNSPGVLRMLCLMKRYHTDVDYNPETQEHAKSLLYKINTFISDTKAILLGMKPIRLKAGSSEPALWKKLIQARDSIEAFLLDNFDTPSAVLTVMELIGTFYSNTEMEVPDVNDSIDLALVLATLNTVSNFYTLVGLKQAGDAKGSSADTSNLLLESLLKQSLDFRSAVRSIALTKIKKTDSDLPVNKDVTKELMATCDEYRDNLKVLGIDIKDHSQGSSWAFNDKLSLQN